MQEIVFFGSFHDRMLNRETHCDHTDALLPVRRIESGLIEIKSTAVPESVQCAESTALQPQDEETEPSTFERQTAEGIMKGQLMRRLHRVRPTSLIPTPVVQVEQHPERLSPLIFFFHEVKDQRALLVQVLEAAVEIIAKALSDWTIC